jgi:hypothetical protein
MKSRLLLFLTTLLAAFGPFHLAHAQPVTFQSGSDGSDGALNVTNHTTLQVPPDGVFNFTTITINPGYYLYFMRNAANTPVYLLATGDVNIAGYIDVTGGNATQSLPGKGGPGGFSGGVAGTDSSFPGEGLGPGGGKVGNHGNFHAGGEDTQNKRNLSGGGSYGAVPTDVYGANFYSPTYGNSLLIPLIGGSGGAGAVYSAALATANGAGGGGGGAILVASNTKITMNGDIMAHGGQGWGYLYSNGSYTGDKGQVGSGGAVRLVAPTILGTGRIYAGGQTTTSNFGGAGRIRLDCIVHSTPTLTFSGGLVTMGSNPFIFPTGSSPSLRLKSVAGTNVPAGTTTTYMVTLPPGSPATQPVTVEASNFGGSFSYIVKVVPERGSSTQYEGTVNNGATNPATSTINVIFPLNSPSQVYVWAKQLVTP